MVWSGVGAGLSGVVRCGSRIKWCGPVVVVRCGSRVKWCGSVWEPD